MARNIDIYSAKRASALANPTAATVFKQADDATKPAFVRLPEQSGFARFKLHAWGRFTTGTSSTILATIQYNADVSVAGVVAAATAANNTDFKALSSRTLATITRPWNLELDCVWDSTSQRLSGQSNGFSSETIETANAAITALTGVDCATGKVGFVVSAIFGSTNASNSAVLDGFTLEVM